MFQLINNSINWITNFPQKSQEAHISWFRHREQYVYPVHIKMWIPATTIVEQVSKCKHSYNFQFFFP